MVHRMARLMALLELLVALVLGIFTHGAGAQQTLTIFSHPTLPLTEEMIKGFEAENPGVRIDQRLNMSGTMRSEGLLLAIASGTAPDLAYTHLDFVPIFTHRGLLLELDEFIASGAISAETLAAFFPGILEQARVGGKLHFLPLRQSVNATMYNRVMFAEAGACSSDTRGVSSTSAALPSPRAWRTSSPRAGRGRR